jgi:hypothetical protein
MYFGQSALDCEKKLLLCNERRGRDVTGFYLCQHTSFIPLAMLANTAIYHVA